MAAQNQQIIFSAKNLPEGVTLEGSELVVASPFIDKPCNQATIPITATITLSLDMLKK